MLARGQNFPRSSPSANGAPIRGQIPYRSNLANGFSIVVLQSKAKEASHTRLQSRELQLSKVSFQEEDHYYSTRHRQVQCRCSRSGTPHVAGDIGTPDSIRYPNCPVSPSASLFLEEVLVGGPWLLQAGMPVPAGSPHLIKPPQPGRVVGQSPCPIFRFETSGLRVACP